MDLFLNHLSKSSKVTFDVSAISEDWTPSEISFKLSKKRFSYGVFSLPQYVPAVIPATAKKSAVPAAILKNSLAPLSFVRIPKYLLSIRYAVNSKLPSSKLSLIKSTISCNVSQYSSKVIVTGPFIIKSLLTASKS